MILLDIDGTLTEPGKNVPPDSALDAVRRAQAKGHIVVLCSGRNYGMLSPLLKYGFDGVVSCAGGCIEYGDQMVYDCPMTPEQQEKVLTAFQESGVYRTIGSRYYSYTDEGFKEFLAENTQSEANSELINKAFNKGTAVMRLCEHLRMAREDAIAFGDSMNDLEMLQAAGLGVCMENGSPALKKAAGMICPSVTENGLYTAFTQLNLI